ncbi:MAG: GrpB family protein [Alphaproteobacteria bacterium]
MNELGLKRGTILLVPHNPIWKHIYIEEVKQLKKLLTKDFLASEHIGSTAVSGILAKPILDMMVALPSLDIISNYKSQLESLGFHDRGYPIMLHDHVLFAKGPEEARTVYVKFTVLGSDFWNECVLFRDYLNHYTSAARAYEKLKLKLAAQLNPNDRKNYTLMKSEFIKEIINKAKRKQS